MNARTLLPRTLPGTTWFTGGLHLGRSFDPSTWNSHVKPIDTVWIIGGLLSSTLTGLDIADVLALLVKCNGSKYLVAGPGDHPFHGDQHGKLMLDRWTQRYRDEGGLLGIVNGAQIAERNMPMKLPLLGGKLTVALSAMAYADTPGVDSASGYAPYRPIAPRGNAQRTWLLHAEPDVPACDRQHRQLNVSMPTRGGFVSAQDVHTVITDSPASAGAVAGDALL